jgi:hypothetical protein
MYNLLATFYIRKRWKVPAPRAERSSVTNGFKLFPKELSRYAIMMIVTVFCCNGLAGCAYVSSFPFDELPDKSGPISSGRLDSGAVRKALGNPLVASRYWGVELFRDASSQTEIPTALFIPFAMIKDDIYRYTLVSYDKDRVAESATTGIHRRPPNWRMVSPIHNDYLTLDLHTGNFTFVVEWEDRQQETLFVTPIRRDAYLERARFSSHCTALIGCGTHECSDELWLDGGPSLPLPCRLKQYDSVAALNLAPGNHTLKASGGHWQHGKVAGLLSGEQSIHFSCRKGEIVYLAIDVSVQEYSWWGAKGVEWKINLQKDMPEIFVDRHLLLYRGDKWFVDPEPEY